MNAIKQPVKRQHYRMWAGEVSMVIDDGEGNAVPLLLRGNGMTIVSDKDKILPADMLTAQQVIQQQLFRTMGEEYKKVKDVLSCTILFTAYMGFLSQEEMDISKKIAEVEKKANQEAEKNNPYAN